MSRRIDTLALYKSEAKFRFAQRIRNALTFFPNFKANKLQNWFTAVDCVVRKQLIETNIFI